MRSLFKITNNEKGSAILVAILILALLTAIGMNSLRTTDIEVQITANDKWKKASFSSADAGTQAGIMLLEQCINDVGFDDDGSGNSTFTIGDITGNDYTLWMNRTNTMPTDTNRDAFYPRLNTNGEPHTNLIVAVPASGTGDTQFAAGNSMVMVAGYEGDAGKGAGGGGTYKPFEIRSQRVGFKGSQSTVGMGWIHLNK